LGKGGGEFGVRGVEKIPLPIKASLLKRKDSKEGTVSPFGWGKKLGHLQLKKKNYQWGVKKPFQGSPESPIEKDRVRLQ